MSNLMSISRFEDKWESYSVGSTYHSMSSGLDSVSILQDGYNSSWMLLGL